MTSISGKADHLLMPPGYDKFSLGESVCQSLGQHRDDQVFRTEVVSVNKVHSQFLGFQEGMILDICGEA